jgi:VIT1/CCC1 family predicted Fe2+/Mn2+ transporter
MADGLTCAMGIITGLAITHHPAAVWAAALSAGLAEFPGMASGQYQSAPEDGHAAALVCGAASTAGAVAPAVPYLVVTGAAALWSAVAVAVAVCTLIALVRPDRGWKAFAQSYGITAAAAGLCVAGGLIPH